MFGFMYPRTAEHPSLRDAPLRRPIQTGLNGLQVPARRNEPCPGAAQLPQPVLEDRLKVCKPRVLLRAVGPGLDPRLSPPLIPGRIHPPTEPEKRHLTCRGMLCKTSAGDLKKAQNSLETSPGTGHHMCLPREASLVTHRQRTRCRAGGGDHVLPRLDTKCVLQEG